jgi:hypothetical protein
VPVHAKKACRRAEVYLQSFLTSAQGGGEWSVRRPGSTASEQRPIPHATLRNGGCRTPGTVWKLWRKEDASVPGGYVIELQNVIGDAVI